MPKSVTGSNSGRVTVKVGEWSLRFTWVLFPIYREVKVGALHKVPMCLAPRKCVFLRRGRRHGCLGASRFVAESARPWKCVFLRHGRRRGCLGASRFVAGTARFIMV
ncbi:hypothetical protein L3X38_038714 [Prunus dulcis]|uniref:Uncharacterized protein n=1 Tax=Prunus dulcis TaxID=3755 RepID=A0AAD4V7Z4_PRUDU|nr:hypothetical protein L3X38_038714 [Prunus dulcis]